VPVIVVVVVLVLVLVVVLVLVSCRERWDAGVGLLGRQDDCSGQDTDAERGRA